MNPLKIFRSINIDKVNTKQVDTPQGSTEVIQVEGWAYKAKTSDGRYIIDSDYENIDTNNIDLQRFHKGTLPLLFNHDQTKVVGKVTGVRKEAEGLKITADLYNFANDELSQMVIPRVKAGLISALSIGVLVKDFDLIEQDGEEYLQIKASEAFEVSLVPVPANSSALFSLVGTTSKNASVVVSKAILKSDNPTICEDIETCMIKGADIKTKAIKNKVLSDTPWSDVDKTELAHKVKDKGIKYVNEAYLYAGDPEKVSTYKLPHHEMQGDDLVVNINGVHAAYAALQGAHGKKPDLSEEDLASAKAHLRKHYREMVAQGVAEEIPEALKSLDKEDHPLKGSNTKSKAKGETQVDAESEPKGETEGGTDNEPKGEGETESEPKGEPEGGTDNEPKEETKDNTDGGANGEPEGKSEGESEGESEGNANSEPEGESEGEPDDEAGDKKAETPQPSLELSLSYLQDVKLVDLEEEQLEAVYEVAAALTEGIEQLVVEQLKETLVDSQSPAKA